MTRTDIVRTADPDQFIQPWPRKTREIQDRYFDSTIWNDFRFRSDDVVIATYSKSGTTWVQQIVAQLVLDRDDIDLAAISPWLDVRVTEKEAVFATLEEQAHRRFIKTHLPVDALKFSPAAKYLYVGRDGRDIVWSLYNHHKNYTDDFYRRINDPAEGLGPLVARPPDSIVGYFRDWLDRDGYPFWPFWENVRSWWKNRLLPNVLLVHFADLKRDLTSEIRRIATFLEIDLDDDALARVVHRSSFDHMKANAERYAPLGGRIWQGGAKTFIHKGTNGRWRDVLTPGDIRNYEQSAKARLGIPCAHWLAAGRLAEGEGVQ